MQMMLVDAIDLIPTKERPKSRRLGPLEFFLELLSALPQAEHPYAYLKAIEPSTPRKPRT